MARRAAGGASVSAPASHSRLTALDALRGLIMVIMALDHTRDFIHAGAMSFSPEDLTRTTPIIFLTRWVTHICAPVFMCSAGAGAFLRLQRPGTTRRRAVLVPVHARPGADRRRARRHAGGDELLAADAVSAPAPRPVGARAVDDRAGGARSSAAAGPARRQHSRHRPAQHARWRAGGELRRAVRCLEHPASARRVLPRRHSCRRGLPADTVVWP